jgi:hypothetical protein
MTKLSKQWKTLTRDQKKTWRDWARSNRMTLESGAVRRVSGHKALTIVLSNRAVAGEAVNASTLPTSINWLSGALSTRDAGPYTENAGYVGFRADQNIAVATQWRVWATKPVPVNDPAPLASLRFIKHFSMGPMVVDDIVQPSLGPEYIAVHGSWDGPGNDGDWSPAEMYVWFRLHQYHGGHLGPGVILKGRIAVEL